MPTIEKTLWKVYHFESSTSERMYQTLAWSDGTLSCDCPGWTKRTLPNGARMCKHTRSVIAGLGEREAKMVTDGMMNLAKFQIPKVIGAPKPDAPINPVRKLNLEDEE